MKKTQKIAFSILWFFAISAITYATITTYTWVNSDAGTTNNDTWTFSVSNIEIYNKEWAPGTHMWNINWEIESDLFGEFNTSPVSLDLIESSLTNCWAWGKTYTISWSIESEYFWTMSTTLDSIYCPWKALWENVTLKFTSSLLWVKNVSWSLTWTTVANIFDKQQVAIIWATSVKWDLSWLESETWNKEINTIDASSLDKSKLWANINKNIANITRSLTAETDTSFDLNNDWTDLTWGKYFYYDYEWVTTGTDNGYGNVWANLTIGSGVNFSNAATIESSITDFAWNSTVIVKWWNVYINSDLVNSKWLTTIIAKRVGDNGWNIYVDPDVTNIDAILIADGSLLSYREWSWILNRNYSSLLSWTLSRQLYIYGSIFTKNVIGSAEAPYGSDAYIDGTTFSDKDDNDFNLANMRQFQTRYASNFPNVDACGWSDKTLWTWGYSSTANLDSIKEYAWAWKMKCFNAKVNSSILTKANYTSDYAPVSTPVSGLRTTWRTESIIIEYNPKLQTEAPYILKSN